METCHSIYTACCPQCGEINLYQRNSHTDLTGYIALLTGGRIKIGYHTAVRLLRNGASVIATSRFPYSALAEYQKEPDYNNWAERLHIFGLDLLRIDLLENFINRICRRFDYLDIIINNAAQTVKDDDGNLKQALIEGELSQRNLPDTVKIENFLPDIKLNNQISCAGIVLTDCNRNAWTKKSGEVSIKELLETQIINVTAPYLMSTALNPLMNKSPHKNRFLINVSSLEGKFSVRKKSSSHPHTNMAKAALNMMTKTFADEYRRNRIYVYSIDPGWVSDQFPGDSRVKPELPLDFDDAAARLTYPILEWKESEKPPTGIFLKDYMQTEW